MKPDYKPFAPIPEFQNNYIAFTNNGISYLKDKKVIITGIVRDLDSKLLDNINQLKFLDKVCEKVNYFIYENDSKDNTVSILEHLRSDNSNFQFLSENIGSKKFGQVRDKERMSNLSEARNKCHKYISKYYADYDYVITIDLDYDFVSYHGILNSFGHFQTYNSSIDGICGSSYSLVWEKGREYIWNYDSFAFRLNHWTSLENTVPEYYHQNPSHWFGLWKPPIGSDLVLINSGFGWCCIYKTSKYLQGKYGETDCEHVVFHKSIYDIGGFAMYLNPSQFIFTESESYKNKK